MKLESEIQREIIKYLKTKCYFVKTISASKSGIPDLLCCHSGKFIALEIKRNETRVAVPLQVYNINKIIDNGGEAYVVWSLEQVKEIIK